MTSPCFKGNNISVIYLRIRIGSFLFMVLERLHHSVPKQCHTPTSFLGGWQWRLPAHCHQSLLSRDLQLLERSATAQQILNQTPQVSPRTWCRSPWSRERDGPIPCRCHWPEQRPYLGRRWDHTRGTSAQSLRSCRLVPLHWCIRQSVGRPPRTLELSGSSRRSDSAARLSIVDSSC